MFGDRSPCKTSGASLTLTSAPPLPSSLSYSPDPMTPPHPHTVLTCSHPHASLPFSCTWRAPRALPPSAYSPPHLHSRRTGGHNRPANWSPFRFPTTLPGLHTYVHMAAALPAKSLGSVRCVKFTHHFFIF